MRMEVVTDRLAVRMKPEKSSKIVKFVHRNEVLDIVENRGDWVKHNKGWSLLKDNGNRYLSPIPVVRTAASIKKQEEDARMQEIRSVLNIPESRTTTRKKEEKPKESKTQKKPDEKEDKKKREEDKKKEELTEEEKAQGLREEREDDVDYTETKNDTILLSGDATRFIKNVRGIHGMPYQFLETADQRYGGSVFGRKFTSKIVNRIPVLLLVPGEPLFMDGYSKKQKHDLQTAIVNKVVDGVEGIFESKNGKLYSFKFAYKQYYKYVNHMLNSMAIYLDIGEKTLDGKSLASYNWQDYANSAFRNLVSSKEVVAFYIDSDTQIQESFSNNTTESQLSSAVNGLGSMAKEIQFLMGGQQGTLYQQMMDGAVEPTLQILSDFASKYANIIPTSVANKLMGGFQNLTAGGKMAFPEIWDDSDFSRSYDISLKLRTPDADKFSIFMNILVPIAHLICLTAPHQMGPDGYQSPFLVRAFYKGFFNIDMGIITSLNIEKGDKGRWTLDGLPTEVDVTFSMKDLYQILFINDGSDKLEVFNNTIMLDYIANMCGVNVNVPDMQKVAMLWYNQTKNNIVDAFTGNAFMGVENALSNLVGKIF